jgi:nucleotide-binding universal stress UspA family protein
LQESEFAMTTTQILVGIDGSAASLNAVRWAATEAGRRKASVAIVFCSNAISYGPWTTTPMVRTELREAARPMVDEAIALVRGIDPNVAVRGRVVLGSAPRVLLSMSATCGMVVLGRTGKGAVVSSVLGSVSRAVLAGAHCPVVTVTDDSVQQEPIRRILLGVTPEHPARAALDFAMAEAELRGVPLLAVHGWHVPILPYPREFGESPVPSVEIATAVKDVHNWLTDLIGAARARSVQVAVRSGRPADVLAELSQPGDLVVLGQHHAGPWHLARLGSLASELTRILPNPLAVVGSAVAVPVSETEPVAARSTERPAPAPSASGILSY